MLQITMSTFVIQLICGAVLNICAVSSKAVSSKATTDTFLTPLRLTLPPHLRSYTTSGSTKPGWTLLFKFVQRISIFLVMLLSVSRSIAIAAPFKKLHKIAAMGALISYCVLLIGIDAVHQNLDSYRYISIGPFCTDNPLHSQNESYSGWVTTVKTLTTLELGLPSVITFFSFVVCAVKLSRPSPDFIQKRRNRRASFTVTVFTGLFLFCNLPFFTLMVLNTLTRALPHYDYPEPFFTSIFMSRYSWLIAKIVLTVLNAALNPVVYYYRITEYRTWLLNQGLNSQTMSSPNSGEREISSQHCNTMSHGVSASDNGYHGNGLGSPSEVEFVMLLPVERGLVGEKISVVDTVDKGVDKSLKVTQ